MKAPGLHNPFPARPDDPDERLAITQNGGSRLSRRAARAPGVVADDTRLDVAHCGAHRQAVEHEVAQGVGGRPYLFPNVVLPEQTT